jgi:hypothetical protein
MAHFTYTYVSRTGAFDPTNLFSNPDPVNFTFSVGFGLLNDLFLSLDVLLIIEKLDFNQMDLLKIG